MLPSANVLQPSRPEEQPPPPPPPEPVGNSHGSRMAMTIGLAIAAVALIGTIVYFMVSGGSSSEDPTDVKVGSEQVDYGDEPTAAATATASAKPKVAPRPRFKPKAKPKADEDIYEDLE